MTAGSEAFDVVQEEIDRGIEAVTPEGEWPSWLVTANSEVYRITLWRRRPNGSVWFEALPVQVEGWAEPPTPDMAEKLQAARELAEWQCRKARTVMEGLGLAEGRTPVDEGLPALWKQGATDAFLAGRDA